MKVAIPYDNGEIFPHFGKSPAFLIAEIEGKSIRSQEVVPTEGSGHSALVDFLKSRGIDAVVCGGIGEGARNGLSGADITVIAGQGGSAEAALVFFANGDLKDASSGVCDRHHGRGGHDGSHSCPHHHDGSAGSSCGSSCCGRG